MPSTPSTVRRHGDKANDPSPEAASRDDDPEAMDEVIMAIDMKDNGTIGCAYYVAMEEALFIQEDVPMAGVDLVEMLLMRVEPTTVLASIRAPDDLIEFLEAGAQDFGQNRQGQSYHLLPSVRAGSGADPNKRRVLECLYPAHTEFFGIQLRQCQRAPHESRSWCFGLPGNAIQHRSRRRSSGPRGSPARVRIWPGETHASGYLDQPREPHLSESVRAFCYSCF